MARQVAKDNFRDSRMSEIAELKKSGCFQTASIDQSKGHRLYRARFVDKLKQDRTKRSRLLFAASNDQERGLFTAAPTMKRITLRLILSIAASYRFPVFTRDITKAFVMTKTPLRRPMYMRAPSEFKLQKGKVLKVMRPLYSMPESLMHWYTTYKNYHREKLQME